MAAAYKLPRVQAEAAKDEEGEREYANPAAQQTPYPRSPVLRWWSHSGLVASGIPEVDSSGCVGCALDTAQEFAHGVGSSYRGFGAGNNEQRPLPVGMSLS